MPFQRLPESVQTLSAELLEQTIHAEAEAAVLGLPQGSFVSKAIKRGTYWYLQRMEGDRKRQVYLGKESPSLLSWMEEVRQARARSSADEAQRARLSSMLGAGGAVTEGPAVAKVLQLLAESGVFRMGGILVGTQAFPRSRAIRLAQAVDLGPPAGLRADEGGQGSAAGRGSPGRAPGGSSR